MLNKRKPVHPGELFKEEVLIPLGLTVTHAAEDLGVSRKALSELINCRSSLSPEMAIRIGKATNTTPESWLNMQTKLDLWEAERGELDVIAFPVKPRKSDNVKNDKHAAV
jgi:addiction module HigA family antidote